MSGHAISTFMAMESQKTITLCFQVHGQGTWEFIASCSLKSGELQAATLQVTTETGLF